MAFSTRFDQHFAQVVVVDIGVIDGVKASLAWLCLRCRRAGLKEHAEVPFAWAFGL